MKRLVLLLLILHSLVVYPQTDKSSRQNRDDSLGSVLLGYEFLSTWIPSKKLISYTHIFNGDWSLELEYAWSTLESPIFGVDLGEITEKRYSLMAKYFAGNSFFFAFGPSLTRFKAKVGNDILERIVDGSTTSFETENIGIMGGIGNRWQMDNGFTFGIDWFRMNLPLVVTSVESEVLGDIVDYDDADEIRDVLHKLNRVPTFVLFGLHLGLTF